MLKSVAAERDAEVQTQGADAAPGSGAGPGGESSFATQQVSGSVRRGRPSSLREAPPRPPLPQVLVRTGAAGPVGRAAVPGALLRLPPQDAPSPTAGRHLLPECHSEGCHRARTCVRGWSRGSRPSGGPASLAALQRLEAGHWLGTRPGVSRGPRVPSEDGPFSRSSVTSAVRAAASQGRSETRGRLAPDGRLGPEGRWPPSAAHALCPVWDGGLVRRLCPSRASCSTSAIGPGPWGRRWNKLGSGERQPVLRPSPGRADGRLPRAAAPRRLSRPRPARPQAFRGLCTAKAITYFGAR